MSDWMAGLSNLKDIGFPIVTAGAVLGVGGLAAFRLWAGRAAHGGFAARVAILIALVAVALVGIVLIGGQDAVRGGRGSVDHSLALLAVVAVVAVASFASRSKRENEEMRRIAAQDL
jgi:hypothetical protein